MIYISNVVCGLLHEDEIHSSSKTLITAKHIFIIIVKNMLNKIENYTSMMMIVGLCPISEGRVASLKAIERLLLLSFKKGE